MRTKEIEKLADVFKALGEFNRLSLVNQLCQSDDPQNAMCLCSCCDVDASVVSRHLKVLVEADIVSAEKKGRERTYSLNKKKLAESLRNLADKIDSAD